MNKTNLTLAALLTLVTGGFIYAIQDGKQSQVQVVEAITGASEVTDSRAKAPVLQQVADSAASGPLHCERGVTRDGKGDVIDRVYCTDGKTAGFLLDPAAESALGDSSTVQVIDGKVYAKQETKAEALSAESVK